ncbi:MarR family transcriptional regulator [Shewanella marisflavi]|uniref:HVO_A0114 family putative DNA-binding protein n=1 Tax=Shewanella TaxID=22 RepID=UPI001C65E7CA|nr:MULTISPECIES: MarR family transcriptional regulator [Shewanella]MCL1043681.1 MarR family transcriptional regulator [Shewanella marisflavi]QYJ85242.1 MarR family transcriptional regulator [Shewanella mesophila]
MKARIGIMSEQLVRARVLAIAQGKYKPAKDEPKVWYTSLNAVSQILNPENIALLRLIDTERPESVTALAELSGRKKSNLSNTLKSLCEKGFARLEKGEGRNMKPVALYTDFEIVIDKEVEDIIAGLQQQAA